MWLLVFGYLGAVAVAVSVAVAVAIALSLIYSCGYLYSVGYLGAVAVAVALALATLKELCPLVCHLRAKHLDINLYVNEATYC